MKYIITIWCKPTSASAEMTDVARDSDALRAIKSFFRGRDIPFAHMVCAYPANKKGTIEKVWCKDARCSVSGRFTSQRTYVERIDVSDASN